MSFSDLMSSGRGPGVIGMLLALLVLIGFGTLFIFAFDEGLQGADQSIEAFVAHQAKEIDSLKSGITKGEKDLEQGPARQTADRKLKELNRENQFRTSGIEGLKKEIAAAREELAVRDKEFEDYKNQFRAFVRSHAKGETMDRLQTLKGNVYEKVTIREVSAIGMQIIHEGGQKRIPYEELPMDLQNRFQFDAKQKAEAIAGEQKQYGEHEAAVAAANALADQQVAEQKQKDAQAYKERSRQALAVKSARLTSLKEEIRDLEQAIPKESRKSLSRAPQMKQQLANKRQEMIALNADVARMKSEIE